MRIEPASGLPRSCFARQASKILPPARLIVAVFAVLITSSACTDAHPPSGSEDEPLASVTNAAWWNGIGDLTPRLPDVVVPGAGADVNLPRVPEGSTCGPRSPFCELGTFCLYPCGETYGTCTAYTDGDATYDAVCGCDGKTYQSEYLAYRARMGVDSTGACLGDGCAGCGLVCSAQCGQDALCSDAEDGVCIQPAECCVDEGGPAVCGCDASWYATACDALRAGTSPGGSGCGPRACDPTDPSNSDCTHDEFCRAEPNGQGTCVARPSTCGDACGGEPVCGSDGTWYASECHALQAGVSVADPEVCAEPPPCTDCLTTEYWMPAQDGLCCDAANPTAAGSCVQRPTVESCSAFETDPVCGCNDVTYRNRCEANADGVTVDFSGPCPPDCPGPDCPCPGDCPPGEVDIQCGAGTQCVTEPEACAEVDQPVCGCNLVTYQNECVALKAGVGVFAAGACPCGMGGACRFPTQVCTRCRPEPSCIARPTQCSTQLAPSCGCDGKTYPNACIALQHGVTEDYPGPCFCGGEQSGIQCNYPDEVCNVCDAGSCVTVLDGCGDRYEPVCGCDGNTYDNKCEATQAGVANWTQGCCPGD